MTQHIFLEPLGRHWSHGQGGLYIQPGPDVASRTYFGLEPGDLLVWGLSQYRWYELGWIFCMENNNPYIYIYMREAVEALLWQMCWRSWRTIFSKQNLKTLELYGIVQTDTWYFAGLQANRPPSIQAMLSSSPLAMLKLKSQVHSFDLQHGVWGLKVLGSLYGKSAGRRSCTSNFMTFLFKQHDFWQCWIFEPKLISSGTSLERRQIQCGLLDQRFFAGTCLTVCLLHVRHFITSNTHLFSSNCNITGPKALQRVV